MIRHTTVPHRTGDRYFYDKELKGYAQVDTRQDAPYFGIWINPIERTIVCFCEGDVTTTVCDTDAELEAEMWGIKSAYGEGFKGIDPGATLQAALEAAGLGAFLH